MDVVSGNGGHDGNVGYNDDRSGDDASIQKRTAALLGDLPVHLHVPISTIETLWYL